MNTFACPVCHAPRQTLYDLLTCHPAQLRTLTDTLGHKPLERMRLTTLVCGPLHKSDKRSIRLALNPAPPKEAA
jgi:hypothetical protein